MKFKLALGLGQLDQLLGLGDGQLVDVEHVIEPSIIIIQDWCTFTFFSHSFWIIQKGMKKNKKKEKKNKKIKENINLILKLKLTTNCRICSGETTPGSQGEWHVQTGRAHAPHPTSQTSPQG